MTLSKYNEVMDKVVVTQDMRSRILQNIEKEAAGEPVETDKVVKITDHHAGVKRYFAVAVAAMAFICVYAAYKNAGGGVQMAGSMSENVAQNMETSGYAEVYDRTKSAFFADIPFLSGLASNTDYSSYDNQVSVATYHIGGNEIVVRQMPESRGEEIPEAYSADAVSDSTQEFTVGDVVVTLSGSEDGFYTATWTNNGIVYELESTELLSFDDMRELMKEIIK